MVRQKYKIWPKWPLFSSCVRKIFWVTIWYKYHAFPYGLEKWLYTNLSWFLRIVATSLSPLERIFSSSHFKPTCFNWREMMLALHKSVISKCLQMNTFTNKQGHIVQKQRKKLDKDKNKLPLEVFFYFNKKNVQATHA